MTDTPTPNTGAAVDFLMCYSGNDPIMLTAIIPDGGGLESLTVRPETEAAKTRDWINARQGKANIYFTVNPTIKPMSGQGIKAKKIDIRGMKALHVDIDPRVGEDPAQELERGIRVLEGYNPPPTYIIKSGNGVQGFWVLDEELQTNGSEELAADLEAYNQQIALILHADACHNIDRIMRLPGTINVPDAKKRKKGRVPTLASLHFSDLDRVYSIKQFTAAPRVQQKSTGAGTGAVVKITGNLPRVDLDKLPEKVSAKCKEIIVQGDDPDDPTRFPSRSEALFYVCCELARGGVDDDTIAAILMDRDLGISSSVLEKPRSQEYAARQIQRAREEVISPELRRLNEAHAVIADLGGKCRVISEVFDHSMNRPRISRQSFEDFRNRYMHETVQEGKKEYPMGAWWLKNPLRRQFDTLVFAPGRSVEGAYNLWKGFACESIPGDCSLYIAHIHDNICSSNEVYFTYLMNWMARAVQKPDSPGEVAIVLRGRMGTGKGVFVKTFGGLWGRHFLQVSDPKHLVGSFNAHLRDCVVLFGDEAFYAGDKKHESILKTLVTEETFMIEGKGVDAEAAPNYTHLLLASNNQWVVPAGGDERRFFVLDVGDQKMQDSSYFKAIKQQMDAGGMEALLHMLLTRDISEFDVRRFPRTAALQEQKELSYTYEESWWVEKLKEGTLLKGVVGWPKEVAKEGLQSDYLDYCLKLRNQKPMTPTALGKFLNRAMPADYPRGFQKWTNRVTYDEDGEPRQERDRVYFYEVAPIQACRDHWEKNWGTQEGGWPPLDMDEG